MLDSSAWQAIEALGTVAAIFVALLVAIIGWQISFQKDKKQERAVRYLLAGEIRDDLAELGNLHDWEVCVSAEVCKTVQECRSDALRKTFVELKHEMGERMPKVADCATSLVQVHRHTKDITQQLGLLTMALEPRELAELDDFYQRMQVIHERHGNLLSHKNYENEEHMSCGKECQLVLYHELARAHHIGSKLKASLEESGMHTS